MDEKVSHFKKGRSEWSHSKMTALWWTEQACLTCPPQIKLIYINFLQINWDLTRKIERPKYTMFTWFMSKGALKLFFYLLPESTILFCLQIDSLDIIRTRYEYIILFAPRNTFLRLWMVYNILTLFNLGWWVEKLHPPPPNFLWTSIKCSK